MTITYEAARDAVVTELQTFWSAAYPTIPLHYENTARVDADQQGQAYAMAEVEFLPAFQASLEAAPMTLVYGHLSVTVLSKEGTGTRSGLVMCNALIAAMKYRSFSGVVTMAPSLGRKVEVAGWHHQDAIIPFRFYN